MGLFSHFSHTRRPAIGTVLIVEDEPLVAFENEHTLVHAGYRVADTVERCDRAIEAMDAGGIDLVIADISLPGDRDGMEVAREARARGIAVLFATGHCPPEAQGLAVGWIAKPFASRDLVRAIRVVDRLIAGRPVPMVPGAMTLF